MRFGIITADLKTTEPATTRLPMLFVVVVSGIIIGMTFNWAKLLSGSTLLNLSM
jgi:hypothetical protein